MFARAIPRLTPEEYLKLERAAEFKSEYHHGQMFAMSGGTFTHAVLEGSVPGRFARLLEAATAGY